MLPNQNQNTQPLNFNLRRFVFIETAVREEMEKDQVVVRNLIPVLRQALEQDERSHGMTDRLWVKWVFLICALTAYAGYKQMCISGTQTSIGQSNPQAFKLSSNAKLYAVMGLLFSLMAKFLNTALHGQRSYLALESFPKERDQLTAILTKFKKAGDADLSNALRALGEIRTQIEQALSGDHPEVTNAVVALYQAYSELLPEAKECEQKNPRKNPGKRS
jgi:hypothetical protein